MGKNLELVDEWSFVGASIKKSVVEEGEESDYTNGINYSQDDAPLKTVLFLREEAFGDHVVVTENRGKEVPKLQGGFPLVES